MSLNVAIGILLLILGTTIFVVVGNYYFFYIGTAIQLAGAYFIYRAYRGNRM